MLENGEVALDVRPGDEFAAGHVPGSVNIALSGQFASWAGTVLGLAAHPVLIAASLDVRRGPEWDAAHIDGAAWWPLDNFKVSPPEIDRDAPIAVHCKGGYRSMIAASLLQRAGFSHVTNVIGGFDAWQQANLPSVTAKPVGV